MVSTATFLQPIQPSVDGRILADTLKAEHGDRRRAAPFFVATWSGAVVEILYSNDLHSDQWMRSLACLRESFERNGAPDSAASYALDDSTRLRVVPLAGEIDSAFAVFVESVPTRASIEVARQRYRLTRREVEVLVLVVGGKTGREIADILCITTATVNDHTSSLLRKIGVSRRLELVAVMQECAWNAGQAQGDGLGRSQG